MPIGVCVHCCRDYYLGGVEAVEEHACAQCGRPLISIDTLLRASAPEDSPPEPEEGAGEGKPPA